MIQVKVFNQRDPQWANEKHGTSDSTIAQTGCTICDICSVLWHAGYKDIDPAKLNEKLTKNGGYAQGNLVVWHKVAELYPKLTWIYRHYSYKNDLAKEWIDRGMLPIIRVSAAPIGGAPGGKHWVNFVGDKKSADPWTGKIVDTSTWEPDGMALYEYTPVNSEVPEEGNNMSNMYGSPNQYDLANPESMKVAVDELNKVQTGFYIQKTEAERLLNEAVEKVKSDCNGDKKKLENTIKKLTDERLAVLKMLELSEDSDSDAVLAKLKTLIEQSENDQDQNSTPSDTLPTTYNGKEVLAVVIKP